MYKKEVESDGSFFRVSFKSNHVYDSTGFEAFFQFRKHIGDYVKLFIQVLVRNILLKSNL